MAIYRKTRQLGIHSIFAFHKFTDLRISNSAGLQFTLAGRASQKHDSYNVKNTNGKSTKSLGNFENKQPNCTLIFIFVFVFCGLHFVQNGRF
jgi:hypothetical protein